MTRNTRVVLLLTALALAALAIIIMRWGTCIYTVDRERSETAAKFRAIQVAVTNFFNEYGHYPTGETTEILTLLGGKNPKHIEFLKPPIGGNQYQASYFFDGWKQPIKCYVTSNGEFVVYSMGENRRDDGGREDDIVTKVTN
jgi:hypothetical protein